jgi:molecular chaperone HscB
MTDYFEVFGLDRKLGIDTAALQRHFHALSREHHPDFHQMASPEEQARALETSARVNAAYRALRDPIARVDYLVRLEHTPSPAEGKRGEAPAKAPPELLAEMFEIQEALQDARTGGVDDAARATLTTQREALIARREAEEARITGELSAAWDAAAPPEKPRILGALQQALATRAYLRTVIDDLTEALDGTSGETHVAHHRD